MRQMKDSGIAWVGEIPQDWNIRPIRSIVLERIGECWGEDADDENQGEICLRIADFDFNKGRFQETPTIQLTKRLYSLAQVKRCQLKKGDILVEKSGGGEKTPVGRSVLFDKEYIALFANFMDRLRINSKIVLPLYTEYWLRSWYYCKSSPFYINQTTGLQNIDLSLMLAKEKISFPSLAEQQRIADFLDAECEKIDGLKADIQAQIDTLEQYKRSVITEAVTHGLNPDASMKDSGIAWVGNIPLEWDVGRIGGLYELRNEKVSDKVFMPLSVTMKGILPQLETVAKTNDGDNRKLVRKGDFAINSRSDRRGSCGISKYDGSVSLINTILKPRSQMNANYYNWLFHTPIFADEFYKWGHGIVDDLWTTNWQEMKHIQIPIPPLNEQQAIADYLDKKCAEIEQVIADKKSQLETIDEYKKSLIYEYVTGKKEVV